MKKKRNSGMQNIVIILAAIALFAVFTLINPGFATRDNLLVMTKSLVPYAILALGVTFVIATGGIAKFVTPMCRREIIYDKDLLLKGLAALYRDNRKN